MGCVGSRCSTGMRAGGYPMPHQCSLELEPNDFIILFGSALLQMLEPDCVVSSDHGPPEDLPILHNFLKMNGHFIPE